MFGRRRSGAPVSLFPFQSLIAGLIGVLLVIVMLFLIRLFQSSAADPALAARKRQLAQLKKEVAELRKNGTEIPELAPPDAAETAAMQRRLAAMIRQERSRVAVLRERTRSLPNAAPGAPETALQVESPDGKPFRTVDCRADGITVGTGSGKRNFPVRNGNLTSVLAEAADFLAGDPEPVRVVLLVRPASAHYAVLWMAQLEPRLAPRQVTWEPLPSDGPEVMP